MHRRSVRLALALVAFPWFAVNAQPENSQPEPSIEVFAPVTSEDVAIAIQPPGVAANAIELKPIAQCHPTKRRASIVALQWKTPAGEGFGGQRVDISKFRKGFELGRYETTRQLPATTAAVRLEAPEPGINYYWRVLTQSPTGWASSPVGRFEVPICPWDEPSMPTASR